MRIVLMGDSTMQTNNASKYPQTGWGQMLYLFFNEDVSIKNFAKNGCSTKSFIDLGLLDKALKVVDNDTYCLIQFGHNDQKIADPSRYTIPYSSYQDNLRKYIKDVKNRGGIPILLTSVYRRYFDNGVIRDNVHKEYPEAMKQVALEEDVLCLDICEKTKEYLNNLGEVESRRLYMFFSEKIYSNYPQGMTDNSHLRSDGAFMVAKMVCDELKEKNHPLSKWMIESF